MKNIRNNILPLILLTVLVGCSDYFEPNFNNNLSEEAVLDYELNPEYVEGLYVPAYGAIPGSYTTFSGDFLDCATDNAVSNNYNSTAWKMHTVSNFFTSGNYPIYTWSNNYRYIKSIYKFLSVGLNEDIVYRNSNEDRNIQIKKRMEGEAHFLLALNYFQLLRDYAGPVDGEIMGVPIVDKVITEEEALGLKRASYAECVEFIVAHIDTALTSGLLPEYSDEYVNSHPDDNLQSTIYGDGLAGLPTTVACNALKSRLLLYAASPAFSGGNSAQATDYYTRSAKAAKKVIDAIGDLPDIYHPETIDDDYFTKVDANPELILRRASQTKTWEQDNYPPSLGLSVKGSTNPSQNLVDAFPMSNGYPITDTSNSGYSEDMPYEGRDPRFYMTIIYNNAEFHDTNIEMWDGGNTAVGAANISDDSRVSRTNYYLRKWMTEKPSFITGVSSETPWHFTAMFRAVEAYLNFAEAANNAVGPDVMVDGLSARQALRLVRNRAGIPTDGDASIGSDPYLASLADLTPLIKNERRIELCFEGHRFYDLRRWGDDLNTTVKKSEVSTDDNGSTFEYNFNENVYPNQVSFPEYMRYGAIPRSEILTSSNLKQNDGWK
ncbi:Starch-binding associating with outer membrane [Zobellia uliginosa]|uniref:Starch-binding associating with outer membrane n=1 Tax=Zobellia uliginosa TaxID=143224 RepID=A0ABY1KLJ4_9FLAO|nr:RagB/SusD family nutrient uptake outer membrane protein [Zobellia uliginosa]SIS47687.1 Starch-binding associating with outer membrane [Zobellia uliginosa]